MQLNQFSSFSPNEEEKAVSNFSSALSKTENKKIIQSATLYFESNHVKMMMRKICQLTAKNGGYILENEYNQINHEDQIQLTLKIPSTKFDQFIRLISNGNHDKLTFQSITRDDITEKYYDTELRLRNKKLYLIRYQALLSKANSMKDILEIEEAIRKIEEEIESKEGEMNRMKNDLQFSSIEISIKQKNDSVKLNQSSFSYQFTKALKAGSKLIENSFFSLISFWPLTLLLSLIIIQIRKKRKANQ